MAKINLYFPYQFGSNLDLNKEHRDTLTRLFEKPPMDCNDILEGRAQVTRIELAGVGEAVIKYYKRGGMIRHLLRDVYLRSGKPRSRLEFEMLETVRALGVSSPEPLIWAIRGSLFYKAFLVTRKIPGHRALSDVCTQAPEHCEDLLRQTAEQIALLIRNRVHHVDLHPGNVLVDGNRRVYIIDFDKARISTQRQKKLCTAYIKRWKRAVRKYTLPPIIADQLTQELTRLFPR